MKKRIHIQHFTHDKSVQILVDGTVAFEGHPESGRSAFNEWDLAAFLRNNFDASVTDIINDYYFHE